MNPDILAIDRAYQGLSSGEAPNSLELERSLYFVGKKNALSNGMWKRIYAEAASNHLLTAIRRYTQPRRAGKEKLFTVNSKLAKELSKSSRRKLVAIIQFGSARVLLNLFDQWSRRTSVTIEEYLGDAACVRIVSDESDLERVIKDCMFWFDHPGGDLALNKNDPRCLPMSAFSRRRLYLLESPEARRIFKEKYKYLGKGIQWLDDDGKLWDGNGACHGLVPAHICGCALPLGWHWDVSWGKEGSKKMLVSNGWEAWEVGRNGYINVCPDGSIRKGERCRMLSVARR
mgnify:FL=1